jgi:hypothetical protein
VFVSKSFEIADREINSYFERLMEAVGLEPVTAEGYTGDKATRHVERLISKCDVSVGICVFRYEDKTAHRTVTSPWIIRELEFARGQRKKLIVLVEKNVTDLGGLEIDTQLILFDRNDLVGLQEATIRFVQALRWHGLVTA